MTNQSRLVLFGASKAGETYLERNPDANIIAFVDNDTKRQGTQVMGVVVLAPEQLKTLEFDTVIITSLWIDSIYSQLTLQLGIDSSRIKIPNKRELKAELPFSDPNTLALAHQLLIGLNAFFDNHQIKACVDSGTLLGLMREGDLLRWDDDIDFAVDDADFERALELLRDPSGLLPGQDLVVWKATLLKMSGQNVCLNIEFTPKANRGLIPFETSLQRRKSTLGRSELLSSAGIFYAPEQHFNATETLVFKGWPIRIPAQPEQFLTFMYGDWKTPKTQMKLNEYDNRRELSEINPNSIAIEKVMYW
ncbi:nucleoside-diphosphate sugar epimerase/dehydratase [Rheinheimera sp.]|uniref:nucleoside-diphosphate sugar epimerase/dehydratase n=1 Tax=Rheinheimera sp. TaxID=1869214 RepID=UPI003AF4AB60